MEQLISVRELFKNTEASAGKTVSVGGWVRSVRASKAFGFIVLSDGTYFQPVQVVIHLRKLPPGIAVQDLIDGTVFFYKTKKHRCRVFAARQRCNSINGFTFSCGNATSFSNTIVTFLGLLRPAWSS